MSDAEIQNKMMKLEFKIDQVLALNYKVDVAIYRAKIEFLKDKELANELLNSPKELVLLKTW